MLFRQLNDDIHHEGSVARYYFVKRTRIAYGVFLLTKEDNGWNEDDTTHCNTFRLEIVI